jgi:uncharacterized protein (TIGR03437 family)
VLVNEVRIGGGGDAPVIYAGAQPQFAGLDRVNARGARTLISRGEVDLVMTVGGKMANTVRLSVR